MLCGSWRWETTLSFTFFSSLRLLDITYFYPVPLLLDLIRDGRHTISYASKLSRCGEERWESQREDRNSSWKFVLRSVHNICGQGKMPRERVQDLAGRQEWANKLTTFVCEQLLVAVCVCKQIHRLGSLLPAQLTKLIIRLELQPRRDLIFSHPPSLFFFCGCWYTHHMEFQQRCWKWSVVKPVDWQSYDWVKVLPCILRCFYYKQFIAKYRCTWGHAFFVLGNNQDCDSEPFNEVSERRYSLEQRFLQ